MVVEAEGDPTPKVEQEELEMETAVMVLVGKRPKGLEMIIYQWIDRRAGEREFLCCTLGPL